MKPTLLAALTLGILILGLNLSACTEPSMSPTDPAYLPDEEYGYAVLGARVIESITGNGHYEAGTTVRTVTFNVIKRADGTVAGWYHGIERGPGGANIRVRMECLHIDGNEAWAAGTVVAAASPDNIGRPYSLRVVDNGQGANAAPDEVGIARFEYYDCGTEPDLPLRPVNNGNVVVRARLGPQ